ncbi:hypothetical protein PIB30_058617 [Stylosanthes scabra]|uniref:Uncharacterized protein n=1 Tax=Stylosanthes scabra TaxID=79078 RepID=A0ABU6ZIQ0_9FABA|nr:hypothetical protein [Stylosanthes scabra]
MAKAYAPSTRASPRLAALRAQASPPSPTPSLPPKKRPIPATSPIPKPSAGKRTTRISIKPVFRHSQRIAARSGPPTSAPKEKVIIEISSNAVPEHRLEDTICEVVKMDEDHEEDPIKDLEELEDFEEKDVLGDDPRYWNYDDISDWQNADSSDSSAGTSTSNSLDT